MENNTGQQQVYSMSTLNKLSQLVKFNKLSMMGMLLGALTLPAQALTVLTVDGVANSAYTLDGTRQFDNGFLVTPSSQGELAEITITFDETLIGPSGGHTFQAEDPISVFDISMKMFGQTFGRETDIDGNKIGSPYFNITNYHTPGAMDFTLEWVISEVDLAVGLQPFIDGSTGDNYTDILEPSILSLVVYGHGQFQLNNSTVTTGNTYNVGVDLVVVPVPATAWLFATGLAGLAGMSSRRRLKQ